MGNLEPANILVCSGRSLGRTVQVKLANFETTQTVATNGTQIKGTYNFDYAAPEILEEAQAFPQSDVWSLGVLLYVLMSGLPEPGACQHPCLLWPFPRQDQPCRLHAEEEGARQVPHQQDPEVLQGLPQEQALHGHGQPVFHGQAAPVNHRTDPFMQT